MILIVVSVVLISLATRELDKAIARTFGDPSSRVDVSKIKV